MLKKRLIPTRLQVRKAHQIDLGSALRPVQRWRMLFILGQLARVWWHRVMARLRPPAGPGGKHTPERLAQDVREAMERLGGLWIKAAQIMAMRRDIFPKVFCDELAKLQDRAKGFPGSIATEIIEADLGCAVWEVFSDFELVPIAAASIGQVHFARIRKTGARVAVKVQRPGIAESFQRDLRIVRSCVGLLKLLRFMPWAAWDDMFWMLERTLTEELDYRLEVASIRRMRTTLRRDDIHAPKAYRRYCTKRVLVMEFIDGVLMSEYIQAIHDDPETARRWCEENNVNPKKVGKRLYLSFMMQMLNDNLLHGDLHPGNILLLRNSRFALIDFGSVSSLDTGYLEKQNLFNRAMVKRDYSQFADVVLGTVSGLPDVDIEAMRKEIVREWEAWEVFTDARGVPYEQRSLANINMKMAAIFGKYRLPPVWNTLRVARSMAALDFSLRFLIPDINFMKLSRQHQKRARARTARYRSSKKGREGMVNSLNEMVRLPELIRENLTYQGDLIRKRVLRFQASLSKAAAAGKAALTALLHVGVIAAALMIGDYLLVHHGLGKDMIATLHAKDVLDSMPRFPRGVSIVVIVLSLYVLRSLWKVIKIVAQATVHRNPWL